MNKLDRDDVLLVMLATKLLLGKKYGLASDNPKTRARHMAFAEYMGATVDWFDDGGVVFRPPLAQ